MEANQAKMTRHLELAERLEAMARQLREGQYEIQGRLADFQHEVRGLRAAMRVCHRSFK